MGFGLAALAAFLRRAVGRTMAYGGNDGVQRVSQVSSWLRTSPGSKSPRPHLNRHSPALPGICHLRKCTCSRDCFLCDLHRGVIIAGSICSWEFRLQTLAAFLPPVLPSPAEPSSPADPSSPRRAEHNGRLEPARKLHRCVLGPVGQLLPHSRDRWCLLPGL